jgi:hypothetical protein
MSENKLFRKKLTNPLLLNIKLKSQPKDKKAQIKNHLLTIDNTINKIIQTLSIDVITNGPTNVTNENSYVNHLRTPMETIFSHYQEAFNSSFGYNPPSSSNSYIGNKCYDPFSTFQKSSAFLRIVLLSSNCYTLWDSSRPLVDNTKYYGNSFLNSSFRENRIIILHDPANTGDISDATYAPYCFGSHRSIIKSNVNKNNIGKCYSFSYAHQVSVFDKAVCLVNKTHGFHHNIAYGGYIIVQFYNSDIIPNFTNLVHLKV